MAASSVFWITVATVIGHAIPALCESLGTPAKARVPCAMPSLRRDAAGSTSPPRPANMALPPPPIRFRMDPQTIVELEAAAFRRLREHLLRERPDVQNIDLMILVGFCRNCLADWYREAAVERGIAMDKEAAREIVYGMPFAEWKAAHQKDATPEQLAAFAAAQAHHG